MVALGLMDPDQPRSIRIIIRKTEGVVFIVDILPFKGNISPKKKQCLHSCFLRQRPTN